MPNEDPFNLSSDLRSLAEEIGSNASPAPDNRFWRFAKRHPILGFSLLIVGLNSPKLLMLAFVVAFWR